MVYIGVTENPYRRIKQHMRDKPWWRAEVAYIEASRFESRIAALCEEAGLIVWYWPVYNTAIPTPGSPLLHAPMQAPGAIATWSPTGYLLDLHVDRSSPAEERARVEAFARLVERGP